MDLSIIIVNYNVKGLMEQCLLSVLKATAKIKAEIIVVDNASTDGSRDFFSGRFETVHFTWSDVNLGFGKANNLALRKARGEYVLFLNPDTVVPEDCFEKCIGFFRTHEDCGALGVRMLDEKGHFLKESKRGFPTPARSFFKMVGLSKLFPHSKIFSGYHVGHLPENQNHEVEVLAGAFMMLSTEALNRVKGFDEDFFMYGEDIDLSCRIREAGLKNYYFAETSILHYKGKSTPNRSAFYNRHFYGAMKIFVNKHYAAEPVKKYAMLAAIHIRKWLADQWLKVW